MSSRDEEATISQSARSYLHSTGLRLQHQPDDCLPDMPEDLTELDHWGLMALMQEMTAWMSYADGLLTIARIDEREAESYMNAVRAAAVQRAAGKSVTDKKAAAAADKKFLESEADYQVVVAVREVLEAAHRRCEAERFLISRELTRRSHTTSDRSAA